LSNAFVIVRDAIASTDWIDGTGTFVGLGLAGPKVHNICGSAVIFVVVVVGGGTDSHIEFAKMLGCTGRIDGIDYGGGAIGGEGTFAGIRILGGSGGSGGGCFGRCSGGDGCNFSWISDSNRGQIVVSNLRRRLPRRLLRLGLLLALLLLIFIVVFSFGIFGFDEGGDFCY